MCIASFCPVGIKSVRGMNIQLAGKQSHLYVRLMNKLVHVSGLLPSRVDGLIGPALEELSVNADGSVFRDCAGQRLLCDVRLSDKERDKAASLIADALGVDREPLFGGMVGKVRVQVTMPPRSPDGITFSFRFPPARRLTLAEFGLDDRFLDRIRNRSVLISGGMFGGKTSLANALLAHEPWCSQRLLVVEDAPELMPVTPDHVRLSGRDHRELVKTTLRMRGDAVLVGEVRGGEAYDLLQVMNTGLKSTLSTIHANSPEDAKDRLLDLAREAVPGTPDKAVERANFVIVQLERVGGSRRVTHVGE